MDSLLTSFKSLRQIYGKSKSAIDVKFHSMTKDDICAHRYRNEIKQYVVKTYFTLKSMCVVVVIGYSSLALFLSVRM